MASIQRMSIRPAEEQEGTEADDPLRPCENADLVIEAERLGTGAGIGDEQRAGGAGIEQERPRGGVGRVVLDVPEDTEEEDHLGVAVEHRIEERAVRGPLPVARASAPSTISKGATSSSSKPPRPKRPEASTTATAAIDDEAEDARHVGRQAGAGQHAADLIHPGAHAIFDEIGYHRSATLNEATRCWMRPACSYCATTRLPTSVHE